MTIQIQTYQKQVAPARQRGQTRSGVQGAPLDVTRTAGDLSTQILNRTAQRAADAHTKETRDKYEAQMAADILDEATKYYDETRAFEKQHEDTVKRNDARDTSQVYDKFHTKQMNERMQRFAGDPRVQLMWQKQAAQIRQGSLNRGDRYASQEDRLYIKETTDSAITVFHQKVGEISSSSRTPGFKDKSIENLRTKLNGEIKAVNPHADLTALHAQISLDVAVNRIDASLAVNDVDEARRLTASYSKILGASYDEVLGKVETAKINKEASDIAKQIRDTMPDATMTEKREAIIEMTEDERVISKAHDRVKRFHSYEDQQKREQDDAAWEMFAPMIQDAQTGEELDSLLVRVNLTPMSTNMRLKLNGMIYKPRKRPVISNQDKRREVDIKIAEGTISVSELERHYYRHLDKTDFEERKLRIKAEGSAEFNAYLVELETWLPVEGFRGVNKDKRADKTLRFKKQFEKWGKIFAAQNGRFPTAEEMDKERNRRLEKIVYDVDHEFWTQWGDKTIERFDVGSLPQEKYDVPEVEDKLKELGWEDGMEGFEEVRIKAYQSYFDSAEKVDK